MMFFFNNWLLLIPLLFSVLNGSCTQQLSRTKSVPSYVDMGLPSGTLWASCNLGAQSEEKIGDLYAWGENEIQESYSWNTYLYYEDDSFATDEDCEPMIMTKYNLDSLNHKYDGRRILELEDDVVSRKKGVGWHMPTAEDVQELMDFCEWTWGELNGVQGYWVKGGNNNTLFFPITGFKADKDFLQKSVLGCYWTSSLKNIRNSFFASGLTFDKNTIRIEKRPRYFGQAIRPVYNSNNKNNLSLP